MRLSCATARRRKTQEAAVVVALCSSLYHSGTESVHTPDRGHENPRIHPPSTTLYPTEPHYSLRAAAPPWHRNGAAREAADSSMRIDAESASLRTGLRLGKAFSA